MKLVYFQTVSIPLRKLVGLMTALGSMPEPIDLVAADGVARASAGSVFDGDLIVDAASVASAHDAARTALAGASGTVLLVATTADAATGKLLADVTGGAVAGVEATVGTDVGFATDARPPARELAGHAFVRAPLPALALVAGNGALEPIVLVGGRPTFGRLRRPRGGDLFVWSTPEVFDVSRPLDDELEMEQSVAEYVPGVIFCRAALGDRAWHNPAPAAAIVVDDPLLTRRYGCLDFPPLLASARRHGYHVTLAFIPWNQWRTRQRDAAFFLAHQDVFSLCVHGNDHTAGEFESTDFDDLTARACEALLRMDRHRERTGLPYETVMVCPQERYSVEGLRAIAAARRYTAVTNTRLIPEVPAARGRLTGADMLAPAVDAWFGLPLLKRHYAHEGIAKFALGMFLGRPAVLAEHHQFFAFGPDGAERFADDVRAICPDVAWRSLSDMVRRLCWRRRTGPRQWQFRVYADDFRLDPVPDASATYEIERRMPDVASVVAVRAGDREVEFATEGDRLRFAVTAPGPAALLVRIERRTPMAARVRAVTPSYRIQVAVRRGLSEFRDWLASQTSMSAGLAHRLRRTPRSAAR